MGGSGSIDIQDIWHEILDWIKERNIDRIHITLSRGKTVKYDAWSYEKRELTFNGRRNKSKFEGEAHVSIKAPTKYMRKLSDVIMGFIRSEGHRYRFISFSAPQTVIKRYAPSLSTCRCSLEDALIKVKEIINSSRADAMVLFLSTAEYLGGAVDANHHIFTDGNILIEDVMIFGGVEAHHDVSYSINVRNSTWSIVFDEPFETNDAVEQEIYIYAPEDFWDLIITNIKSALGNRKMDIVNEDEEQDEYEDEIDDWDEEGEADEGGFNLSPN